jgi:S1-C subfamily serine protease
MRKLAVAAILFCVIGIVWAQAPTSTSPPVPPIETGADVDLLHGLRRSTVSLGFHQEVGGVQHFVTVGSGVIVAIDPHHACLLTAKHIFYNPEKGYVPTMLYVRIPQIEPRAADDLGVPVPLVVNGQVRWRGSVDADLAVADVPDLSTYKDLHAIFLSDFGGSDDVYQGASVVVMGYPELLGSDYQTTPIARGGIIAWTSPDGRLDHTFLVDANVFSGNSGGPVFHTSGGLTRNGGITLGGAPKLIGIVTRDAYEDSQVRVGSTPVTVTNQQTGEVIPMTSQVLNIGGIGIVEPASKAKQLVLDFMDPTHTLVPIPPAIPK